jgi:hypothetical protein
VHDVRIERGLQKRHTLGDQENFELILLTGSKSAWQNENYVGSGRRLFVG